MAKEEPEIKCPWQEEAPGDWAPAPSELEAAGFLALCCGPDPVDVCSALPRASRPPALKQTGWSLIDPADLGISPPGTVPVLLRAGVEDAAW